jgi:hypothetical protein
MVLLKLIIRRAKASATAALINSNQLPRWNQSVVRTRGFQRDPTSSNRSRAAAQQVTGLCRTGK